MSSEPNNEDRAEWARVGVNAYAEETRFDPNEQVVELEGPDDQDGKDHAEEVISDLLCDMRHLCDVLGISFQGMLERSHSNYTQDVAEEKHKAGEDVPTTVDEIMTLLEPTWGDGK